MPFDNGTRLKDILENKVDEKYYISEEKVKKFIKNIHTYESNAHSKAPMPEKKLLNLKSSNKYGITLYNSIKI